MRVLTIYHLIFIYIIIPYSWRFIQILGKMLVITIIIFNYGLQLTKQIRIATYDPSIYN